MSYVSPNFSTKKDLIAAIKRGGIITVYQPHGLSDIPKDGIVYLEGHHYTQPHKWYARGEMKDGKLVLVR